jgi:hypothetical protein
MAVASTMETAMSTQCGLRHRRRHFLPRRFPVRSSPINELDKVSELLGIRENQLVWRMVWQNRLKR